MNYLKSLDTIYNACLANSSWKEDSETRFLNQIFQWNNEKRVLFYFKDFRITTRIIKATSNINLPINIEQNFRNLYQNDFFNTNFIQLFDYIENLPEPIDFQKELRIIYNDFYKNDSKYNFDKLKNIFRYLTTNLSNYNLYTTQSILLDKIYSGMPVISVKTLNKFFNKNQQYLELYSKLNFVSDKFSYLYQSQLSDIVKEKNRLDINLKEKNELDSKEWDTLLANILNIDLNIFYEEYDKYLNANSSNNLYFNNDYKNTLKYILNTYNKEDKDV